MHQPWPPRGFPALPATLWLSTLDIVFGSITIQGAVLAARRGDKVGLRTEPRGHAVLGLGFLGLQSYAWYKIWTQVAAAADLSSTYLKMFYALTGLHAVHVAGRAGAAGDGHGRRLSRHVRPQEERGRPLHGHLLAFPRCRVVRGVHRRVSAVGWADTAQA